MLLCLRRCNGIVFIHVLLLLVFFRFNDETNVVQSFQPVVLIRNQFRQEPKQKSFNIFNHNHIYQRRQQTSLSAEAPFTENDGNNNANDMDNESMIQWELFQKYHAKGSWKGTWTTYDYLGDVQLETIASVNYEHDNDNTIRQSHTIVVGATQSDCETCFDSMETKDMPVATYTPNDMKKSRLGACGMVNGPSLLRNGASTSDPLCMLRIDVIYLFVCLEE